MGALGGLANKAADGIANAVADPLADPMGMIPPPPQANKMP